MKYSTPSNEEGIDRELIKDIFQLESEDSGEGAVVCEVCGSVIREGERVTAYAFRSDADSSFEIGDVFCQEQEDEYECSWDRTLRELVVRGRVGMVSDVAMQSSWPVLLESEVVGISPIGTVDWCAVDGARSESDADAEDRIDVTRSLVRRGSSGRDGPSSWCDGGGAE